MKRSLFPSPRIPFWALTLSLAGAALPALTRPAFGEGLSAFLADAARLVSQGRVESAWEAFAAVRERVRNAPAASEAGEDLEPDLLELGRVFLLWENPEAAMDVWQAAARRGSRVAPPRMAEALEKTGWPLWLDAETLKTLRAETVWLPGEPFRRAAVASPASLALPAAEDPLHRRRFRHSLAVYLPDLNRRGGGGPNSAAADTGGNASGPVSGYVYQRFLIHYQRPEDQLLAERLARNFAALYALVFEKLGRQSTFDENGLVHVWLVSEGEAGGEQWKEHLYFYDLGRPRSNLEWMREAAHEYGHACLPGGSGFTEPEGWANGELGERLILRWLSPSWTEGGSRRAGEGRDRVGRASLESETLTALNLKASGIEAYLGKYVRPLVAQTAKLGWQPAVVAKRDRSAMDHVMGLALWAEEAHGAPFLREMLNRIPNESATGLWAGYHRAVAERLRPLQTGSSRGSGTARPAPITVSPVAGRLRFYLPMTGRYRLSRIEGGQGPLNLTREASAPGTKGQAKGAAVRVTPGQGWNGNPGWYTVNPAAGQLRIERL